MAEFTNKNPRENASNGGPHPDCFYAANYKNNAQMKYPGKSKECSKEMYDEKSCYWHKTRMAAKEEYECECGIEWPVAVGDAVARNILRTYLQDFNMPVIDMCGKMYCCGPCQNMDSEVASCGEMLVCSKCISRHPNLSRDDSTEE